MRSFIPNKIPAIVFIVLSLANLACFSGRQGRGDTVKIQGAGSSFINPLMQKWVSEYGNINPNIRIDYQSIGSGGGVKQTRDRTIQFGATDVAIKDEDMKSADGEIVHIPVILGAVVLTYNLAGVEKPLRFSPDVIADIFLGKINRWDDARIQAENPEANLPSADLTVVHRSDGSGTSAVFTSYLSKVSPEWKEKVGEGTSPSFPVGLGGKGNEGVTGQIKQTPNTIGYVELAYAVKNKLPVAEIKNRAGQYIVPNFETVTNAAKESLADTPEDLRVSITDAAGANAYPIASYVYVVIYKELPDEKNGKAIVDFLLWGINDGQSFAQPLYYSPLPQEMVKRATAKINSITHGGKILRAEATNVQ
ncbi:MAG: phosphate ABC transporter substrate-binding protein PstS [Pyrinomonadaceae bacterium]|nr:phosphate ABC transporter substrate-binding protein PstS [Pyrinomonadaceae bacterium]